MRWLLDTNVFIDAFAGEANAVKAMKHAREANAEWVGFSAITRLEVLGFAGLSAADEKGLRELLAEFAETEVTSDVIEAAIRLRRSIRIKTPDALIAAAALVHRAELVTRNNTDFRHVPGLVVINPVNL